MGVDQEWRTVGEYGYSLLDSYKAGKRDMEDEYKIAKGIMSGKITPADMQSYKVGVSDCVAVESLGLRGYAKSIESYVRQMVLEDMAKERVEQLFPKADILRIED